MVNKEILQKSLRVSSRSESALQGAFALRRDAAPCEAQPSHQGFDLAWAGILLTYGCPSCFSEPVPAERNGFTSVLSRENRNSPFPQQLVVVGGWGEG